MPTDTMIAIGLIYFLFSFIYFVVTGGVKSHHYLDPITNYYYEWKKLNVLGVLVFTLLLNIVLAPWAIIYWVIKFFVFIFTVGRR
jgi:hypothetical protein